MAEELAKEITKSNGRNSSISTGKRCSLDGGQSILPHFRTSFASCNVGTKSRRNSTGKPNSSNSGRPNFLPHSQTPFPSSHHSSNSRRNSTGKPITSTYGDNIFASNSRRNSIGNPTSLENGSNLRRNILLPHYRTSFVTCNGGGNSKTNSSGKPISSNEEIPHYQTSLASCHGGNSRRNSIERKPSSSNYRASILPHYRTSFITCNGVGNSKRNSMGRPISLINEGNVVPHHQTKQTCLKNGGSISILPHYRTSFASCNGGNLRRNCAAKQSSSNNKENINLPLHLRASTGSCHDSCKQGLQDGFEEKPRVPITKRNIPPPSPKGDNRRIIVQDERKKPISFKPKYSSDSEIRSPNSSNVKQELLLSSKKRSCSAIPRPTMEKPSLSSEVSMRLNAKRNSKINTMASPKSYGGENISLNLSKYKSLKLNSPPRPQMSKQKAEPVRSNPNEMKKTTTMHTIEAENETRLLESVQNESFIESLQSPSPSSSPKSSSSHSISPVFSSEDDLSELEEFEYEYTDDESDKFESEYSDNESVSEANDIIIIQNVESTNVKEGETCKGTKGEKVQYRDQDCAPIKLKFKRGKVVEIETDNNENGPRRLRFRRGRVLETKEEGKVNGRRRIFKRRVDNCRVIKHKSSPKAEKVSLKHQDMEDKKDPQGLLNNVIEETASKLVESRKSKVKALVGAFETVFSIIESAPTTPTAT